MTYLTVPQIAKQFSVKQDTVRNWIKRGALKAANIAQKGQRPMYRVAQAWLDEFVKANLVMAAPYTGRRKKPAGTKDPNFTKYF